VLVIIWCTSYEFYRKHVPSRSRPRVLTISECDSPSHALAMRGTLRSRGWTIDHLAFHMAVSRADQVSSHLHRQRSRRITSFVALLSAL
jgi:hypothetical protein